MLLTNEGQSRIGKEVGCSEKTVSKWRQRWVRLSPQLDEGQMTLLEVLSDAPRCGAPIRFGPERCARIVALACQSPGDFGNPSDVWTRRELKNQVIKDEITPSISERQIGRILDEAQIQPHKVRYWLNPKPDESREQSIREICEVYQKAPRRLEAGEVTLSVDEMTAIQAKERIALDLMPEPKQAGAKKQNPKNKRRIEHEYKRHGTLCLLGAWDVAKGEAFGWCNPTRKEEDFVSFIEKCTSQYPEASRLHIVLDNLNTHQSEALVRWVAAKVGTQEHILGTKGKSGILRNMETRADYLRSEKHPVVFHYTPKHCSWMNQIEIWFGILMRKLLKTASFTSIEALEARILAFIVYFNQTMARPFKWMFQGFEAKISDS